VLLEQADGGKALAKPGLLTNGSLCIWLEVVFRMVLFETTHELVLQVALTSPSYCLLNSLLLFPGMRPFSSGSCSLAYR
jgi:hypothetical protein